MKIGRHINDHCGGILSANSFVSLSYAYYGGLYDGLALSLSRKSPPQVKSTDNTWLYLIYQV